MNLVMCVCARKVVKNEKILVFFLKNNREKKLINKWEKVGI